MSGVRYSEAQVERALLERALCPSNKKAVENLRQHKGFETFTDHTMAAWLRLHSERYSEIAAEQNEKFAKVHAAEAERRIRAMGEVNDALVEKLGEAVAAGNLAPKDLSTAIRNLSVSSAVEQDKIVNPIRGRGQIVEHRPAGDIRAELESRLRRLGMLVDGTAEEIPHDPPGLPSGD